MRPLKKYTPFQRLDFLYIIRDETIYVRAKLIVPLYADESINSPGIVKEEGFYHEETLPVMGDATGLDKLFQLQYIIAFLQYDNIKKPAKDVTEEDFAAIKAAIKATLAGQTYYVKTYITKNPTEDVENTISQNGDIEIRD
ncbi:MAG: hypothetical protein KAR20_18275 [Candidatus Heimdallarchaeota archaeon]|nr:hypothetical protein [Candidatus Heimdallarchaeota archaeon]